MFELVKKIRERTGAGMVAIKKAVDEAGGDEEKAIEILRKQGESKAAKKADRVTKEGVVVSYVHSNKVGALVKLLCETDFVARNEEFVALAKDIAMHITAMSPKFIKPEDVPTELIEKEKEIWRALLETEKKPAEMIEKIMAGKEKKFREESALLTQSFVKNPEITINELIVAAIGKMGEKIEVSEMSRIEL
ncbi:MAG: Elongation factor Ts [Candidatus Moranbacteria bacterium GW2011_GWC2_37_73]|nr:MAG: Elongation factor Ts [Parcubacteria group bacterium GW2011_GWC1_36_108]KKQ00683.1 MAG: Elongation factor Ts [Candidatus Moranbacteria bacterium GW2011_GWD1_36_198]KKQ01552.1 MAG: Elongation factor Ts [Candidatus Moranbacteria bacterium GW2011_GWD2_36_198]KKQ40404.1 MAG: Elongation factor Ts [Candidatus Moranbacteria bacterium GW2011_GWC2_37_73]MDD5464497.1 elongation factor Ts [Candidatus Moranbacteria bacterium]